jgi:hypothetical protein
VDLCSGCVGGADLTQRVQQIGHFTGVLEVVKTGGAAGQYGRRVGCSGLVQRVEQIGSVTWVVEAGVAGGAAGAGVAGTVGVGGGRRWAGGSAQVFGGLPTGAVRGVGGPGRGA